MELVLNDHYILRVRHKGKEINAVCRYLHNDKKHPMGWGNWHMYRYTVETEYLEVLAKIDVDSMQIIPAPEVKDFESGKWYQVRYRGSGDFVVAKCVVSHNAGAVDVPGEDTHVKLFGVVPYNITKNNITSFTFGPVVEPAI